MKAVAKETLAILDAGGYEAPSGRRVVIARELREAVAGTVHYDPASLEWMPDAPARFAGTRVEVTGETTAAASRRLAGEDPIALNFASAKNPGGGFQGGARAQEEDLARASGLYPCLLRAPGYYEANRACGSMLYTDHMIVSPRVPFFRDDGMKLLEEPFVVSVLTAPAPNAGEARRRGVGDAEIRRALDRRVRYVLQVCAERGHGTLVLGAWGCGVFRNDPAIVADAFGRWLEHPSFAGRFERVVFAVLDRGSEQATLRAFEERLGQQQVAT